MKKVAIANPLHAPYGQAAVSAMQKEGIYDQAKEKFVLGENISQAASFVVWGAADIGIVALSLALSPTNERAGAVRCDRCGRVSCYRSGLCPQFVQKQRQCATVSVVHQERQRRGTAGKLRLRCQRANAAVVRYLSYYQYGLNLDWQSDTFRILICLGAYTSVSKAMVLEQG